MSVTVIATLDTKGLEAAFVRDELAALGVKALLVDAGCLGVPAVRADISRDEVFAAAGTTLAEMQSRADRGLAMTAAAAGVTKLVAALFAEGRSTGVLGLGGSANTTIATAAMRALPLGVPKLMVSTLASGQVRPWVGDKDILMLNAVVDVLGINRINRLIFSQAARAMSGMVHGARTRTDPSALLAASSGRNSGLATDEVPGNRPADRPLIAATMFGVTTPCITHAKQILEAAGYEVLVFHATGNGGQAMESLIADGLIVGVLDITTTELADELVGGILSAGPDRLTAAGRRGIPQVISAGALDMVNFGPPETIPAGFSNRLFYRHNPTVTLMRTTVAENYQIGREIGRKAQAATGPTAIVFPRQGVSAIDRTGQPFDDPPSRTALLAGIRETCGRTEVVEIDRHINDPEFAVAAAERLLAMLAHVNSPRSEPAAGDSPHRS